MKWFCCPQFFRYEKQQRGRLREFYQFNADIIGETSPAADAEIVALVIDLMRAFGFEKNDFVVRVSSRDIWTLGFLADKLGDIVEAAKNEPEFFQILDKIERNPSEADLRLKKFNTSLDEVRNF